MQESLEASLVRIHTADGHVVGAGFVVGERHILTCAHVISQALGLTTAAVDLPQAAVSLDFPFVPPRTLFTAKVVLWCPPLSDGSDDIAGLELQDEPPAGLKAVRFATAEDVWEHPFRAFGFPAGHDDGVWATGRLLGSQATDWIQIEDVKAQGFAVAPGFSGAPVWDEQLQGVMGMVVAASRPSDTRTAFVIPLEALAAAWPLLTVPQGQPRNPYKGLRPFTQRDVADFFGREAVVEKVVELVSSLVTDQPARSSTRLLTILGPSGVGKSSLVMAGLLPKLQEGAVPGSKDWMYLDPLVPGKHPLEALASTLKPQFHGTSFKTLLEDLEDDAARGLHLLTMQLAKQRGTCVVLLIDQFEELFTQTESEDERQRFIHLLLNACSEPRGPVVAVLTLRADFYDRPMQYPELFRLIEAQHFSLLAIAPDDLRRVVEQPAALPDVQITFEGDLVNRLLFEVQGQVGALPLLQFTLDQLFHRRSGRQLALSSYSEIGGVKGALTRQAEDTYAKLPSEEHRKLARALFVRLIDPGATELDTTRRRAALSEFTLDDPTQTRLLRETMDAFIAGRLLTTNEVAGTMIIEVSHEAVIREWKRLAEWMHEARKDIPLQQTISKDVTEWEQHNKPADRLYRGSQLKEARAWVKRSTPSRNEIAFLRASAAHQVRFVVSVLTVLLLLTSSIGIVSWFLTRPAPDLTHVHVTNLNDHGPGSLRQAIDDSPTGSTIMFDEPLSGTIMLMSQLNIPRNLTIQGPTARTVSVSSGTRGHRVHVQLGFSVIISNLIFKDSIIRLNSFIDNEGTLTLINSTVSDNRADFSGGGGIDNEGMLTLINSTVSDNRADFSGGNNGGGIYNNGALTLINSTVSDNRTYYGNGGGIYSADTLTLINSTVSDNRADFRGGGGIYNTFEDKLSLINSTVSDNSASSIGGIYNAGTLSLSNSTVSGNSASGPNGVGGIEIASFGCRNCSPAQADLNFSTIYDNRGSGVADIAIQDVSITSNGHSKPIKQVSQVKISNSIVAGDPAHPGPDIVGMLASYRYNLFQDDSGAIFDPATSIQHRTDKTLSVNDLTRLFASPVGLLNNKGTTKTLALAPESPAVDQVPLRYCQVKSIFNNQSRMYTDQRGMKRPDGIEDACDIGAYEYVDQQV